MTGVGAVIAIGAATANAFAIVLQAGEDRRSPPARAGRLSLFRVLVQRRRWLAGTALMVLAWPLQIWALALAPITVIQPLLATTSLVLLGVARVKLHERIGVLEMTGVLAIVAGIGLIVWAAPHHTVHDPGAVRVAVPLAIIGAAAAIAYVLGRVRPSWALAFVVGAGLAYAWVDFVNKLLANALSEGLWAAAALWLAATVAFGAVAFLEETSALQRRPSVTVAPVIGAIHDPLPVIMALWTGVDVWGSAPHRVAALAAGLVIVSVGAAVLGRSRAVAGVSGDPGVAAGTRRRLACCAQDARRRGARGAASGAPG